MAESAGSPESIADNFQDGNSSPSFSSGSDDCRPVESFRSKAYRLAATSPFTRSWAVESVTVGLWVVSFIGIWFNILTLFYISFLPLFTMPLLYEKYEDQVDSFAEKAMVEIKKQYAEFDAKVLSQTPIGGLKKD